MTVWLVYIKDNRGGFELQLWHEPFVGCTHAADRVVARHDITKLPESVGFIGDIAWFVNKFPPPKIEDVAA